MISPLRPHVHLNNISPTISPTLIYPHQQRWSRSSGAQCASGPALLAQLRSSHAPLQAYLHRFKLAESPICPSCGIEPETTTHLLMHCISYVVQRRRLRRTLGKDQSLGLEILGDENQIKPLMIFISDTKQFMDSHGDLHHGTQDDEGNGWWRRPTTLKTVDNEDWQDHQDPSFSLPLTSLFLSLFLFFLSFLLIFQSLTLSTSLHILLRYHLAYFTLLHHIIVLAYHTSSHICAHIALEPPQEATTVGASQTYIL